MRLHYVKEYTVSQVKHLAVKYQSDYAKDMYAKVAIFDITEDRLVDAVSPLIAKKSGVFV